GTRIQILAPIIRGRKGEYQKLFDSIRKNGFVRVRVDGELYSIDEEDVKLDKNKKHTIEAVVDRIVIKKDIRGRLSDSMETALKMADGIAVVNIIDGEDLIFSEKFACIDCGISIDEIAPRLFSFNSPFGKCERCDGLGTLLEIDEELVVPDKTKSIMEGAIHPWGESMLKGDSWTFSVIEGLSKKYKIDLNKPIDQMSNEALKIILYGNEGEKFKISYKRDDGVLNLNQSFEGVIPNLKRRYYETQSDYMKGEIEKYMSNSPCPVCNGARLKKEALSITVGGKNISEFCKMPVLEELDFIKNIVLSEKNAIISKQIFKEINSRLNFLVNVGLDYLNLSRMSGTLSGGEAQRIRLATQIGSSLVGVLYILDEPSIGLHQRDNGKLIKTLKNLRDIGNTLIVVEHDEDTMREADYIVDMGPGAGYKGGEIVALGTLEDIINNEESLTGKYLSGKLKVDVPDTRKEKNGKNIKVIGAKENNLKNIDVEFPLGLFLCVTGVSGSGKSTLVNQILYKGLNKKINRTKDIPGEHDEILGDEYIDKIIDIDQSPIGRTPRSNPATYTGVFDLIREVFANTNESKMKGYKSGRFSFNVKGGRCEACSGDGIIKIEMQFLSDVYVPCEVCKGKRYNRETLEVKFKGKNIHEVLEMTVDEACIFFENLPRIKSKLDMLLDVGLGYIKLGQPATQLSGGEAQRIKLAYELSKKSTGKTMYILDEPTTGLHIHDVKRLIKILKKLVEKGNSVIVIEHNLDVIKCADYIIDLGPEGGDRGGTILAMGTPEEIVKNKKSYTGQYLEKMI
ncbi:MAG: excinuclease ABC subunit UvrA, partial [Oscillospiraceae bacterium]|nr:excinuclease ABC subunit UvrA [Oscillospiraceae bacterium]